MKIKVLVEDVNNSNVFINEHGISYYIETTNHKILFDTGKTNAFLINAKKMGIDLSCIDTTVISHGHYDHGGGLKSFIEINPNSNIYINKKGFNDYYSLQNNLEYKYIGLDKDLKNYEKIIYIDSNYCIDDNIELFTNRVFKYKNMISNKNLFEISNKKKINDKFMHEQNLIIKENDLYILFIGCGHNGVENIIQSFYKLKKRMPDIVVGGFHLMSNSTGVVENYERVEELGDYLLNTKAKFYTCHCTGIESYYQLKKKLKDKIFYINTGSEINM